MPSDFSRSTARPRPTWSWWITPGFPVPSTSAHEARVEGRDRLEGPDDGEADQVGEAHLPARGPGQVLVQDRPVHLEELGRDRSHARGGGDRQRCRHVLCDARRRAPQWRRRRRRGGRRVDGVGRRRGGRSRHRRRVRAVSSRCSHRGPRHARFGRRYGGRRPRRCGHRHGGHATGDVVGEEFAPALAHRRRVAPVLLEHVVDQPGVGAERTTGRWARGSGLVLRHRIDPTGAPRREAPCAPGISLRHHARDQRGNRVGLGPGRPHREPTTRRPPCRRASRWRRRRRPDGRPGARVTGPGRVVRADRAPAGGPPRPHLRPTRLPPFARHAPGPLTRRARRRPRRVGRRRARRRGGPLLRRRRGPRRRARGPRRHRCRGRLRASPALVRLVAAPQRLEHRGRGPGHLRRRVLPPRGRRCRMGPAERPGPRRPPGRRARPRGRAVRHPSTRLALRPGDVARAPGRSDAAGHSIWHHRRAIDALVELVPDAEVVEIAGSAHGAPLSHPDAFAGFVRRVVDRASGTPRPGAGARRQA